MVERSAMAESLSNLSSAALNSQPSTFDKLCEIVAKLRAPGGCPWDREQTHESLLPATIEEAYEVAEAARAKNDAHFREELGDLLLLVVMHAEIAREAGRFDIDHVVCDVTEKLVRRHPHVFGKSDARDSGAVLQQWEAIKREEKRSDSHYLASLPRALPALMRAQKAQSKAARVNFDWSELRDVLAKVEEELGETKSAIGSLAAASPPRGGQDRQSLEDEIGDLLFAVVNLARKCKLDAESALQKGKRLGDVDLAELDEIWNQIKRTSNIERLTRNAEPPEFDVRCWTVASASAFAIFAIPMSILINLLLAVWLVVALLMVLVILMQRPKSEGLGAAFGGAVTENIFGAQTTNVLVKFTAWLAAIFFLVTFVLSILYARKSAGESALRRELMKTQAAATASPAPAASRPSSPSSAAPDSGAGVLPTGSATPIASPPSSVPVAPSASPAPSAEKKL
jgi:nucleoside triphosphate diphosphatase